jgi:deoxyinosine 3'endonuclease (endonuclease V)
MKISLFAAVFGAAWHLGVVAEQVIVGVARIS